MNAEDVDLEGLGAIPDPFAEDVRATLPRRSLPVATRAPTRSRAVAERWAALGAALLWNAAWVLFDRRPDLGRLPTSHLAIGLGIPLAAAALALAASVRRGPHGLGEPIPRLAALAIAAPALFVAGAWFAAEPNVAGHPFWRAALGCVTTTAVLAVVPLIAAGWAYRHAFVGSSWRTATLGVACGALAAATMSIACSNGSLLHVLVGHGSMMLALAILGLLVVRKLTVA
ncbi:MAG: NrsF family protein [Myxococcota bacterium]|nr:NrsF family protein [Myxococcota bacterium]